MNFRTSSFLLTPFSLLLTTSLLAQSPTGPFGWLKHDTPIPEICFTNVTQIPPPAPPGIPPMFAPPPPGQAPAAVITLGLSTTLPPSDFARIKELARGLDYDWEKCYRFVRDHIAYAPYFGILRGPERTLLDREGNDADQAFLLLALLRASGYTATIRHASTNTTNGFYVPLHNHNGNTPYNAADWLGVSTDGTLDDIFQRIVRQLTRAEREVVLRQQGSVYYIYTDHFWVTLTLGGISHDLDPSFKPMLRTPGRNIPTDMAYNRAALISAAGGTVNSFSILNISANNLETHLNARAASLYAAWANPDTTAAAFIGETQTVPQAPADTTYFHGHKTGTNPDFLAQPDYYKNPYRASMTLNHDNTIAKQVFLDEIGPRGLWFSYTAASPHPSATLKLDDTDIIAESSGASTSNATVTLSIAYAPAPMAATYSLTRNTTYVYAFPVGFGGDAPGGMRAWATEELAKITMTGLTNTHPRVLARAMQLAGHQWLSQSAMTYATYNRITGINERHFYNIGMAAQERAPYVDMKNSFGYSTGDATSFDGRVLFASALEHAVLDQLNGTNAPAVSTVGLIALHHNNTSGKATYFATPANYSNVRFRLTGYTPGQLDRFDDAIAQGRSLLLPQNGALTLNKWTGAGYIAHGPQSLGSNTYTTSMGISGDLNGGFPTLDHLIESGSVVNLFFNASFDLGFNIASPEILVADPVALPSGAFVESETDLTSDGIRPLSFTRHYDSRTRLTPGPLGRGWSHNYDATLSFISDPDAVMGARGSAAAVIPTAVAIAVVEDMLAEQNTLTPGENARRWVIAALAVQWWTKQLVDATASVNIGPKSLTFHKRTDGTYAPYPGVTSVLTRTNTTHYLKERAGNNYTFRPDGKLTTITAPDGHNTTLTYNLAAPYNLTTVTTASHNNSLRLLWASGTISSVTNNAGNTVNYYYTAPNTATRCLTRVSDPLNRRTYLAYDTTSRALVSIQDHDNNYLIRNFYNTLGQVTNQTTATGHPWAFGYAAGTHAWDQDPHGHRQSFTYSPEGRLLQRTNYDGLTTAYDYDTLGRTTATYRSSPADPTLLLPHTSFTYDIHGNLTEAHTLPTTSSLLLPPSSLLPTTYSFSYDPLHRPLTITDPSGATVSNTYNTANQIIATTTLSTNHYPLITTTYAYTTYGRLLTEKILAPDGATLRQTDYTYHSTASQNRGLPTSKTVTGPGLPTAGVREEYTYTHARLTTRKDPRGNNTTYTYNTRGQPLTVQAPLSATTTYTYGNNKRLATSRDPLGRTTTYRWTPSGSLAATILPNGATITNAYDALDRLLWTRDPRGTVSSNALDAAGRTLATWNGGRTSPSATFTYDHVGNLTEAHTFPTSPLLPTTSSFTYDGLDRPLTTTHPSGLTTSNAYNHAGHLTATTRHPTSSLPPTTSSFTYDSLGRPTAQTTPLGHTTTFTLDPLGRATAHTNPQGHTYATAYDALSRTTATTNALGIQTLRNFYDNNGNVTNRLDANGTQVRTTYDTLNRPTAVTTLPGGGAQAAPASSFTYAANGNLLTAVNAAATLTFAYDTMDRLTNAVTRVTHTTPARTFTTRWQRDPGGLVTNLVYATGKNVSYTRDADGNIIAVKDWLGNQWTFTRDNLGRLTQITPVIASVPAKQTSFDYDNAGRLSSWSVQGIAGRTIAYDGLDRRATDTITHGPIPKPTLQRTAQNTFDAADKLISSSVRYGQGTNSTPHITETFLYDNNGALTNWSGGLTLSYNALGQVASAGYEEYRYDALGNRIIMPVCCSDEGIVITDHADPLKRPLMEADEDDGIPYRFYIWADNRLLGLIDDYGDNDYYLTLAHSDEMGNVIAYTEGNYLIYSANYGPHGEDWGSTGYLPAPFGWLGGYGVQTLYDGTPLKLYLTRYRLYSATLNRFLSSDPLGIAGGLNLYEYGASNPMVYVDPLGLKPQNTSSELYWEQGRDSYALTPAQQMENWMWEMGLPTGSVFDPTFGEVLWQGAKDTLGFLFTGTLPDNPIRASAIQTLAVANMGGGMNVASIATPHAGQTVYRVWGGKALPEGRSWTPVDPRTVSDFRNLAGLPPENLGRFMSQGVLQNSAGVIVQPATPLGGNIGGLVEFVVPNPSQQIILKNVMGLNPGF